jgi:hypothetical protein
MEVMSSTGGWTVDAVEAFCALAVAAVRSRIRTKVMRNIKLLTRPGDFRLEIADLKFQDSRILDFRF